MYPVKTRSGYKAYNCSKPEIAITGGSGICDRCGKPHYVGYLIPVLNGWYCESCFKDWDADARYYGDDNAVEARHDAYYRKMIPVFG